MLSNTSGVIKRHLISTTIVVTILVQVRVPRCLQLVDDFISLMAGPTSESVNKIESPTAEGK